MKNRTVRAVLNALPELVKNNVITEELSLKIQNYYAEKDSFSGRDTISMIIGVLAVLMIGGGIISLIAHNWDVLSRLQKTLIAFSPLLTGQALLFYSLTKNKPQAWIESASLFTALSVAAVISLVGQIYNIPGNLTNFLFIWMLLIYPLIPLTKSLSTIMIYLTGITFWAGHAYSSDSHTYFYWIFIAAFIPVMYIMAKDNINSNKVSVSLWFSALSILFAAGFVFGQSYSGTGHLVYPLLFILMLLFGFNLKDRLESPYANSFTLIGYGGLIVLTYIFSFEESWKYMFKETNANIFILYAALLPAVILSYFRKVRVKFLLLSFLFIFAAALLISYFTIPEIRSSIAGMLSLSALIFISASALVIILHNKASAFNSSERFYILTSLPLLIVTIDIFREIEFLPVIIFSLYLLAVGGNIILQGISGRKISRLNIGMIIVIAVLLTRFFDSNLSFLIKGTAFITTGIIFLSVNYYLTKFYFVKTEARVE